MSVSQAVYVVVYRNGVQKQELFLQLAQLQYGLIRSYLVVEEEIWNVRLHLPFLSRACWAESEVWLVVQEPHSVLSFDRILYWELVQIALPIGSNAPIVN
jgi:hypothetical protein